MLWSFVLFLLLTQTQSGCKSELPSFVTVTEELEPVYNDDYGDDEDSGFSSFREDPAENAALQATLPAKIGF